MSSHYTVAAQPSLRVVHPRDTELALFHPKLGFQRSSLIGSYLFSRPGPALQRKQDSASWQVLLRVMYAKRVLLLPTSSSRHVALSMPLVCSSGCWHKVHSSQQDSPQTRTWQSISHSLKLAEYTKPNSMLYTFTCR